MLRRLIGDPVQMVFHPAGDLGKVRADPGQLDQVLVNIAVNARDAMPDGGQLTIATANATVEAAEASAYGVPPGRYVVLSIADTGTGMTEDTRARIFEPFFTTKGTGEGTGLGLSTVYGIVQQSGGGIRVETTPGRGSRFTIALPRVDHE
jgi:signal transduction histidine kinase